MNWTIEEAIKCLKANGNIRREGWKSGRHLKITEVSGATSLWEFESGQTPSLYRFTYADVIANDWSAAP